MKFQKSQKKWIISKLLVSVTLVGLAAIDSNARDEYVLYDGPTGVSCEAFNKGARFPWTRMGGDYVDAVGTDYGSIPFVKTDLNPKMAKGTKITFNVTEMADTEIFAFRRLSNQGSAKFSSREGFSPPTLEVTYVNGERETLTATADSMIPNTKDGKPDQCEMFGTGLNQISTLSTQFMFAIQFPELKGPVKIATLVLTVEKIFGGTDLGLFKLKVPRRSQPVTTGIASLFKDDIGLEKHPSVLYMESFEDLGGEPVIPLRKTPEAASDGTPGSWALRTFIKGYFPNMSWKFNFTQDQHRFHNNWLGVTWDPEGAIGNGLNLHFRSDRLGGTKTPGFSIRNKTGSEAEEMYVRYYVRFDEHFLNPPECTGGKLPGFSGNRDNLHCGMSGSTPDGYCGWALRMEFGLNCDTQSPTYGKINHSVYAYWPEKTVPYGVVFPSSQNGPHGNMEVNKWHCVEQYVKINTPGKKDGVVKTWVDGRLGVDKEDWMLRKALDAEHPKYNGDQINGIMELWGTFHYGGKQPMGGKNKLKGYDGDAKIDQIVVAKERIGCANITGGQK